MAEKRRNLLCAVPINYAKKSPSISIFFADFPEIHRDMVQSVIRAWRKGGTLTSSSIRTEHSTK